jgi:hypothetical protein
MARHYFLLCLFFYIGYGFIQTPSRLQRFPRDRNLKSVDEDYFNRPGPWDDKDLTTLLDANKAWAKRVLAERPRFFEEIRRGHAPKILWIGCR